MLEAAGLAGRTWPQDRPVACMEASIAMVDPNVLTRQANRVWKTVANPAKADATCEDNT